MRPTSRRIASVRFCLAVLCTLCAAPAFSQPAIDATVQPVPGRPGGTQQTRATNAVTAESLIQQADEILASAARTQAALGQKPQPAGAVADAPLRLVPEELHLGKVYLVGKQVRYLLVKTWLVNQTDEPITVLRESFRLTTRGRELLPGDPPRQPGLVRISAGRRAVEISEVVKTGPLTVKPDQPASVSVVFFDLPGLADVPAMTLHLPVGEKQIALDLNDYALGIMQLTVERLGPRGLLGLVKIDGEITAVGAGGLGEVLESLVKEKSVRVVLTWGQDAPGVQPDLAHWLVQSAVRVGNAPVNDGQHPTLPAAIRELHLADLPEGTGLPNHPGPRRVHDSVAEAVAAALIGAYETLPIDELIHEIESGHPLTRPAAIAAGGRLPAGKLPLLIELTADEDEAVATAATSALREFGSDAAIGRLVTLARQGPASIRATAVESLAGSRYGTAHEALGELLAASANGPLVIPPETLVSVLAKYPRPLWSNALANLAREGDPAVRGEALDALSRLGHPQLMEAFETALADDDAKLRTRAFALLVDRQDAESEALALRFALQHLESQPPTRDMLVLLQRTKDQRAVPLLLKHLNGGRSRQSELIHLLSMIGGIDIRDALEEVYPRLERTLQPQVLATLAQMQSPKFYEFAATALRSNDPALLSTAQQQLQADGGPEAVALLIKALFESEQPSVISYAANGLAGIGTHEARVALRRAARMGGNRAEAAGKAWWALQASSAGRDSYTAGRAAREREDWKQAAERFGDAIELDPMFVDAWTGRANAHMQLSDYDAARADYEQVLKLDPSDAAAVTCLGILRVFDGRIEEGLEFVRDRAEPFGNDELFAYNRACLYSVAADQLEKEDAARAERLRTDAVGELTRAIELGMIDPESVAWMRKDPDLKSLHDRPDFEKAVSEAERQMKKAPAEK